MDDQLNKLIYKVSTNSAMRFLNSNTTWIEKDLFTIASVIFNIETAVKLGQQLPIISIPISQETATHVDLKKLKNELEDLLLNILIKDIVLKFKIKDMSARRRNLNIKFPDCDTVCLFSGGIDSYSGILNCKEQYKDVIGVSVLHGDQPWGSNIINVLVDKIQSNERINFFKAFAPKMLSRGYSQLRGFLYCLYGGIYVNLVKANNLVITECGPTMYQPRFSPYDTVTMTTHPFVLNKAKTILELFLRKKVNFVIPYENMTKSEVIAASPLKENLKFTHSCISLRFGKNEGACFGCTIRRLGFLVAGAEDTVYTKDPIGNSTYNADNLISLLRFSYDVLMDYRNMPYSSTENIMNYNKLDLFKRFSLDTFCGLYIYKTQINPLNNYLDPIYDSGMLSIGKEKIIKRIEKVRRFTFKPNFNKYI
jgi:7-cyano-7-deazaguanine synthase in queuosine biosynthesis